MGHPDTARGRPGTRAPHLWLRRAGQPISSLDLFGQGFVVLTGPEGSAWRGAAEAAGRRLAVPVQAHVLGTTGEVVDPDRRFTGSYGVAAGGAVLVRPDGFIGWRSVARPRDPTEALTGALEALLSRNV